MQIMVLKYVFSRYISCLEELTVEMLKKIQFQHNGDWLDNIDMEKYDDDVSFNISFVYHLNDQVV
jgi:hypothetical protein